MASPSSLSKDTESKHLNAAESVLNDITERAEEHDDPKDHLHIPGNQEKAHSWFRAVFPYDSLEDFESQWGLGNYVIDRQTCQKSFEPMSIYVRVGMHLLYVKVMSLRTDSGMMCMAPTVAPKTQADPLLIDIDTTEPNRRMFYNGSARKSFSRIKV